MPNPQVPAADIGLPSSPTPAEAELRYLLQRARVDEFHLHVSREDGAWLVELRDPSQQRSPYHGEGSSFDEAWFGRAQSAGPREAMPLANEDVELIRLLRGEIAPEFFLVIDCFADAWRVVWRDRAEASCVHEGRGPSFLEAWPSEGRAGILSPKEIHRLSAKVVRIRRIAGLVGERGELSASLDDLTAETMPGVCGCMDAIVELANDVSDFLDDLLIFGRARGEATR